MFNRAKQSGAVSGTAADLPEANPQAFKGKGRTLTGGEAPVSTGRAWGPVLAVCVGHIACPPARLRV